MIKKLFLGFNITDLNQDVIIRVKEYILQKVQLARNSYDILDAEGRNVSQWRKVNVDVLKYCNFAHYF